MSFFFLDSTARAAWAAATSQQAQLEGLRDEWSGQMSVRYYSSADAHLATVTHATPIVDTTTTPRSLRLGAWVAESHINPGTAAYCILQVPAGADILRADVSLAGAISDPGGRVRVDIGTTLRVQATASLPVSYIPGVGYRANINANSASDVDYDITSGSLLADRWWNGYGGGNSFASMVSSYSGSVWAAEYGSAGAIIVHGGGHGGNIGAFGYVFDFSTRLWSCVGAPVNVPTIAEWCGYSDGRDSGSYSTSLDARSLDWLDYNHSGSYIKLSDHEYLQNTYIPPSMGGGTLGSLLLPEAHFDQSGSTNDPRPGGSGDNALWAPHLMSLSTGVMSRAASAPYGGWPGYSTVISVVDTTRSKLWYFLNGSPPQAYYIDLTGSPPYSRTSHTVQKASSGNASWLPVNNCSWLYVEAADCIVAFAPYDQNSLPPATPDDPLTVYVYDMSSGVPVDLELSIPTQAMPYGGIYVGVAWHETLQCFYLYEGYGSSSMLTLTPSSLDFSSCTWAWGEESFANAHTGASPASKASFVAGNAQFNAAQGKLVYVPALDCLAWHDGPAVSAACFDGETRDGIVQLWRAPGASV